MIPTQTGSCHALVPAAGSGSRMGTPADRPMPKQYLQLAGRPLIWHALATLCATPAIANVFVVLAPDDALWPAAQMAALGPKLRVLRCGGETRAQSVANGLREMAGELGDIGHDWILVHDAARPCLTIALVEKLIAEVGEDDAGGLLAVPVADTLKRAYDGGRVLETVAREGLWQAQTPQMFRHRLLLDALDFAPAVTDEASAIEALGLSPRLVAADVSNLKVTYPLDLKLAEWILENRDKP
ncbi:2-C-methyl-D-erythritol 4-phosphate cytidylyltransferase [Sulfuritalea hydrogenivorans]|uniref:2-C-methyl-D-erythritol 4-phosphate cytidylyltransferase n=1 Tax=Sulfuritalea hydrogenivorans sk43H TaxID=1223802 RepID=W0SEV0_9PROT|nr:2-C-methyl-D-erythritol 4-phosphate cytidylyltransferase [Sulfuritalea hydrogenivorans]BAO29566.1 2-C-methyl-D-erythritol 4-phosphate cytidylyltransferase [Sulfuritalea hydrogenivorans sk43H]